VSKTLSTVRPLSTNSLNLLPIVEYTYLSSLSCSYINVNGEFKLPIVSSNLVSFPSLTNKTNFFLGVFFASGSSEYIYSSSPSSE